MQTWHEGAVRRTITRLEPRIEQELGSGRRRAEILERLDEHGPALVAAFHELYGWKWDFAHDLETIIGVCIDGAADRPRRLRRRDRDGNRWMFDNTTLWAMTYVDRFVGTFQRLPDAIDHLSSLGVTHLHLMPPYAVAQPRNDGGYAVEDYRSTRSDLGTISELRIAIDELADAGIDVVLDFVANHTADTHPWAIAAREGDAEFAEFYFLFDDRTEPDRHVEHLRPIFPDREGDAFTWHPEIGEGKWVWTTFYEFQWDLNYRNPAVTAAMAAELLHIANLGATVVRADATPFLWKELGTACENLDQAHTLMRIFNLVLAIAAPSTKLLSEAIVHPDEVSRYVRPDEARLGYNPLVMSSVWEALATRDTTLLATGLERRLGLLPGCQWISYLRCHDDIGWGFADDDAIANGIDPDGHRRFLNAFYSGQFPGSFARGMKFQHDLDTGDARISGTLASLAGLESALESADSSEVDTAVARVLMLHAFIFTVVGIPLIYLGDELGQLNDYGFENDPHRCHDNRWAHRPIFSWDTLGYANDGSGVPGRLLNGIRRLVQVRRSIEAISGEEFLPIVQPTAQREVIGFERRSRSHRMAGLFNFSERSLRAEPRSSAWKTVYAQAVTDATIGPYGVLLQVSRDPD